jgi:uncharacterized protein YkwD
MKRLLVLISLLILVACGETPPVSPSGETPTLPTPTDLAPELQTLLKLVNEARSVQRNCGSKMFVATHALTPNSKLTLAAQKHSQDMSINKQLSHTTQPGAINYAPGTTFDARIKQEGYVFKTAGENIAQGFNNSESVLKAWLASEGHCRNIMNPAFTEIGLGKEGSYWSQSFAAPQ